MNFWVLPFFLTAFSYLSLGIWVITRRKSQAHRLYGVLCITTCMWQGIWALLFAGHLDGQHQMVKFCYSGIVFIPAVFYHFISEFTGQENRKFWPRLAYGVATLLALSVWAGHLFLNGFNTFTWGMAAKAGVLHPLFAVLVTAIIVRSLVLLRRMQIDSLTSELKKRQTFLVKLATYIYCGGAIDLFSNYGFSVFPLSFLFTGVAVLLFGYAMFRYEFLAVSLPRESEGERVRRETASMEMGRLGMTAAFPLISQGEVLGYLLLGEKMSEQSYSKEDLLLLRIVANQAALASQRVRYLEMAVHGARTEMLGEIAGGFAHEIKTPLANISLPAELSLLDLNDLEQGQRTLEEVLPELKARMKDIMLQTVKASEKIEAIRQFSKPGQVKMEPVEMTQILQGSIGLLDHLMGLSQIKIKFDFPQGLFLVRGDAKQLEIVFVNLIKNAVEAMMGNPSQALARELVLKGHQDGDWMIISVKDSGPGMKRTDIAHLFEAYFTTKGSEGTGMGLFLSHQVVKAHGGAIDVKSEEGRGTEFIIRLPKFISKDRENAHQAA